jgi:predicted aspartyl protease
MGLTVLEIEVGNPATPEKTEKVEFLVDSGAVYSVVPTPILERLGIRPFQEQQFRLADGSKILRKKGTLFSGMEIWPALRMSSSAKKGTATFLGL